MVRNKEKETINRIVMSAGLAVLVHGFWMALTCASIALFAPPNGTVVTAQCLAALAVAGALFLVLELDDPFSGLIRISNEPMLNALNQLSR